MQTIVVASQKGGAGKTTLSGHLAVEAARCGHRVALLDTDPQGGLAAWWNVRQAEEPHFAQVQAGGLRKTLGDLAASFTMTFIDTPPALTDSIFETIGLANMVVVPVQPSPHDLRAVAATMSLIRRSRVPAVFVVNRARQGTRLTADAAVALSQYGTVAPILVADRQDFRASMIDGRTAYEIDRRSRSADEVTKLWGYLIERMDGEGRA